MSAQSDKGRILIVDDLLAERQFLRQVLEDMGYELIEAPTGEEALDMAAELMPDVILLDVMMPGIDGFEVCRSLRDDPETSGIPVLILSALDSPEDRIRALENGALAYLQKPVSPDELRFHVQNCVRHLRRQRLLEAALRESERKERVRNEWVTYVVNELDDQLLALLESEAAAAPPVDELRELTANMLDCRTLSHPKARVHPMACDLGNHLEETATSRSIPIECESTASGIVDADPELLKRALGQLLTICQDHLGEPEEALQVTSAHLEERVSLEIFAPGTGILHKDFETLRRGEFTQGLDCQSRQELRLQFCRHAMDVMGGSIGAEALPGEGLRCWITLPKHVDEEALPNMVAFERPVFAYDNAVSR